MADTLPSPAVVQKHVIAWALERVAPLRWLLRATQWLTVRRQRVGVLALLRRDDGAVLLARHVLRPRSQWGFPGGWVEPGEDLEGALLRELREELGGSLKVRIERLLLAEQQIADDGAAGVVLVYACALERDRDPAPLPFEVLDVGWFAPDQVQHLVRAFEMRALCSRDGTT